jgi:hypothetical protein
MTSPFSLFLLSSYLVVAVVVSSSLLKLGMPLMRGEIGFVLEDCVVLAGMCGGCVLTCMCICEVGLSGGTVYGALGVVGCDLGCVCVDSACVVVDSACVDSACVGVGMTVASTFVEDVFEGSAFVAAFADSAFAGEDLVFAFEESVFGVAVCVESFAGMGISVVEVV